MAQSFTPGFCGRKSLRAVSVLGFIQSIGENPENWALYLDTRAPEQDHISTYSRRRERSWRSPSAELPSNENFANSFAFSKT